MSLWDADASKCACSAPKPCALRFGILTRRPAGLQGLVSSLWRSRRKRFSFTRYLGLVHMSSECSTAWPRAPCAADCWPPACSPAPAPPLVQSNIDTGGYRSLREGEEVEFELVVGENGKKKAFHVTGPGGEAPLVSHP